jgi:hypothetical protein
LSQSVLPWSFATLSLIPESNQMIHVSHLSGNTSVETWEQVHHTDSSPIHIHIAMANVSACTLPRQLHNLNRYVVGILTGIAQKKIKAQSPFIFNKQPFASTCTPTLILSTDDELIPDPWNNGTLGAS